MCSTPRLSLIRRPGLTEASPTCFNAFTTDSIHTRLTTVGKVLPHARAKIVDAKGNIVPVGQRGELCIAGYQLTMGYWNNPGQGCNNVARCDSRIRLPLIQILSDEIATSGLCLTRLAGHGSRAPENYQVRDPIPAVHSTERGKGDLAT